MLPLASSSSPRCRAAVAGFAVAGGEVLQALRPRRLRTTSKSSRVRSVTRPPLRSTTVTPNVTRSTPARKPPAGPAPPRRRPRTAASNPTHGGILHRLRGGHSPRNHDGSCGEAYNRRIVRCLAVCHTRAGRPAPGGGPCSERGARVDGREPRPSPGASNDFGPAGHRWPIRRSVDSYVKADLSPGTSVIIEDNGRKGLRKVLEAVRDAGGTLVYVLGTGPGDVQRAEELRADFPDVTT